MKLSENTNNSYSENVLFSNKQLEIIRCGEEAGLDVSIYANPDIPSALMEKICWYLRSKHTYVVRYTTDNGESILYKTYVTSRKQEALDSFNSLHLENVRVIDVSLSEELGIILKSVKSDGAIVMEVANEEKV